MLQSFYEAVPMLLPSWFIATLAFLAAGECLYLSLYLIRTHDHLVMRAADVGIMGCFSALVGLHYMMIHLAPDIMRSVALSRIVWSLFLAADVVIIARYIYAIKRPRRLV